MTTVIQPAVVIAAARRSPIGALNGALAPLPAHQLAAPVITAALATAGIAPAEVDETVLGQVLTAGQGMNPARQAARLAGLPDAAPAALVNQVCGSGLRATALALQQIQTGSARIVVAGGQRSMSSAPHVAAIQQGRKLGGQTLRDTVMSDGLSDAFYGYPMGMTAETVAQQYGASTAPHRTPLRSARSKRARRRTVRVNSRTRSSPNISTPATRPGWSTAEPSAIP